MDTAYGYGKTPTPSPKIAKNKVQEAIHLIPDYVELHQPQRSLHHELFVAGLIKDGSEFKKLLFKALFWGGGYVREGGGWKK